jgi:hypothetical protein
MSNSKGQAKMLALFFNNSKMLRGYINFDVIYKNRLDIQAGVGEWLWGRGAVKYTETFIQLSYYFGKNCD